MVSSISSSRFERAWSPSSREDIVYWDRGQLGLSNVYAIEEVRGTLGAMHRGPSCPGASKRRSRESSSRREGRGDHLGDVQEGGTRSGERRFWVCGKVRPLYSFRPNSSPIWLE